MTGGPPSSQQPERDALAEIGGRLVRRLPAVAEAAVANPLVAYGLILVLQLRRIWKVWDYKDLSYGDTANYFVQAASWAHGLHDDIGGSPLYTNFFGSIVALVKDVPAAVMVHRVVIVLASALLVLALMRSLLGPALGLLVAVWWTLLPPNFNVEFEVHLFVLPAILVAALVVARAPGRNALGVALSVLACAALLIRNELIIATAILAVGIVVRELRERRAHRVPVSAYARAYGVPLVIVCLLAGGAYWRSSVQGHAALVEFRAKHDVNMCQVYAFNYQQRHSTTYLASPFNDCAPLMQQTFGRPTPSFLQMATTNPHAVGEFIAWNAKLLRSGLEVALFGATATNDNPDYFPVRHSRTYPLVLALITLVLVIAGLVTISRDWDYWGREWWPQRAWAVAVLGAVAITTLIVVLTQRPSPGYMYGGTVGLLALVGLCTSALLRSLDGSALIASGAIGLTVVLCLTVPSHYHREPRPLYNTVERLQVVRSQLQRPGSVLVTSGLNNAACLYLARTSDRYCTSPSWPKLQAQVARGKSVRAALDRAKATVIYADAQLWANPAFGRFLASPRQAGWRQIGKGCSADGLWSVFVRASDSTPTQSVSAGGSPAPSAVRRLPSNLGDPCLVYRGIYADGWAQKNVFVVLAGGTATNLHLRAEVLPRQHGRGQHVRVLVNGRVVASRSVKPGLVDLRVTIPASSSNRRIELRWVGTAPISATDPRQATALLDFLGTG